MWNVSEEKERARELTITLTYKDGSKDNRLCKLTRHTYKDGSRQNRLCKHSRDTYKDGSKENRRGKCQKNEKK